jgi:hypothetical protein
VALHGGLRRFLVEIDDYTDLRFESHDAGSMTSPCGRCASLNFEAERVGQKGHFSLCCQNGKVGNCFSHLPPTPVALSQYLEGTDVLSRAFRDRIREYNAALSFVSFGADVSPPPGHGPPVFRIHGSIYHASAALEPEPTHEGKYAQLYLYDHGEALQIRTARNPRLSKRVLEDLQTMLEEISPFVASYRYMRDVALEGAGDDTPSVTLGFSANVEGDARRYNRPTMREIAVVFGGEDGAPSQIEILWFIRRTRLPTASTSATIS